MRNKRNQDLDCKVCGYIAKNKISLTLHIRWQHKLSTKEYYDKYLKKSRDGICLNCGNPTKWDMGNGWYSNHCSTKCSNTNPERSNKIKQTCLKKYGVENPSQSTKIKKLKKKTSMKHFGVDNPAKLFKFKQKARQTCFKRYGVYSSNQVKDIQDKKRQTAISHKDYILPSGKKITLQGYEPQFLDFIFKYNILKEDEIDYSPNGIRYIGIDNKEHYYFPDFYILKWNLIVEIKSTWTEFLDKNVLLKEQACKDKGYSYIRIINNNFNILKEMVK